MATKQKEVYVEPVATGQNESTSEGFHVTHLSERDSARFLEMLDADTEPTPALVQAAERHKQRRARVRARNGKAPA